MSTKLEADGFESVADWQPQDLVPHPVNDDFELPRYAHRVAILTGDPQVRLAAALACIAAVVAAFDLLRAAPSL